MRQMRLRRAGTAIAAAIGLCAAISANGAWALTEQSLSETEVEALQFYHDPAQLGEGTVPWQTLADIEVKVSAPAPFQTTMSQDFGESVRSLDGSTVKLQGFIFPLEGGESHEYFLLSAYPPGCPFCLPGGPTNLVEIKSAEPVDYTQDAVLIEGRFEILKDDPTGLYYRLSDARQVAKQLLAALARPITIFALPLDDRGHPTKSWSRWYRPDGVGHEAGDLSVRSTPDPGS